MSDRDLIKDLGIEEFIFQKLASKKFRKWALSVEIQSMIRSVIHDRVSKNEPILFTFPFGGYKLWRLPTAPDVDWAEFFTIAHCLSYLASIAAAYKPGFELIFTSDEVIIERMDNVPKVETDAYTSSFRKLTAEFNKHLPHNAKVTFILIRDLYKNDENIFEQELDKLLAEQRTIWSEESQEKRNARFNMSKLNIRMNGKFQWHLLSKSEQDKKIIDGAICHHAYIQLSRRVKLVKGPDKIIIFTSVIPGIPCVPIGSTKASMVKFWTGHGVLYPKENSFCEVILSPQQLERVKNKKHTFQKIDLIDLANLHSVDVYEKAIMI